MLPENFNQVLLVFPLQASAVSTPSKIDLTLLHFNSFTLSMALQWVVTGVTSLYTFHAKISNAVLYQIACLVASGITDGDLQLSDHISCGNNIPSLINAIYSQLLTGNQHPVD